MYTMISVIIRRESKYITNNLLVKSINHNCVLHVIDTIMSVTIYILLLLFLFGGVLSSHPGT